MVIDPEDDRQGDGQRTSLTGPVYKSTRASGSRSTGTDGIYAHRQPSRRAALDDNDCKFRVPGMSSSLHCSDILVLKLISVLVFILFSFL